MTISLKAYYNQLAKHDWQFEYADDHREWSAGFAAQKRLVLIADEHPAYRVLYDQWLVYVRGEGPRPLVPVEVIDGTAE